MAVWRPKTRMVSFRLSEDEYEYLRKNSISQGARSVSDYARSTLCRLIANETGSNGDPFEAKMNQLDGRMQELTREIARLLHLVENNQQPAAAEFFSPAANS